MNESLNGRMWPWGDKQKCSALSVRMESGEGAGLGRSWPFGLAGAQGRWRGELLGLQCRSKEFYSVASGRAEAGRDTCGNTALDGKRREPRQR